MAAARVTLLFTDLANTAELVQRGGDLRTQGRFQAHHRLLQRLVAAHAGQEPRWLGDGFVSVFPVAADAARCAAALQLAEGRRAVSGRLGLRVAYKAGVSRSTDGGLNWNDADTGLGANNSVLALALDPNVPTTLYAGTTGGLFKTTDGGGRWSAVDAGAGSRMVFALALDPTMSSWLYAGTGSGVFKSTDGGGSWSALNTGLPPNSGVTALVIDPTAPGTLYAGTDGGGVFAIEQVATCGGDCNADGLATIDELVTLVNVALGAASAVECGSGDANGDGQIAIDEIITAVNVVLDGCHRAEQ